MIKIPDDLIAYYTKETNVLSTTCRLMCLYDIRTFLVTGCLTQVSILCLVDDRVTNAGHIACNGTTCTASAI